MEQRLVGDDDEWLAEAQDVEDGSRPCVRNDQIGCAKICVERRLPGPQLDVEAVALDTGDDSRVAVLDDETRVATCLERVEDLLGQHSPYEEVKAKGADRDEAYCHRDPNNIVFRNGLFSLRPRSAFSCS